MTGKGPYSKVLLAAESAVLRSDFGDGNDVDAEGVEVIEVDRGSLVPAEGAPSILPAEDACVDVNAATPAALEGLPGIGPARASGIVEGRPYARLEDLERVAGIGPATLARLRPRLCRPGP